MNAVFTHYCNINCKEQSLLLLCCRQSLLTVRSNGCYYAVDKVLHSVQKVFISAVQNGHVEAEAHK
jgi:hypothetical protein